MESKSEFSDPDPQSSKRLNLVSGGKYRVIKPFIDADGRRHAEGEEWTFTGSRFSRFENEFLLLIRREMNREESFGLICEEDKQYEIIRRFGEYVQMLE